MEVTEHHGDGIADAGQAHLNTFLRNVALKRMRNNKNRGTEQAQLGGGPAEADCIKGTGVWSLLKGGGRLS